MYVCYSGTSLVAINILVVEILVQIIPVECVVLDFVQLRVCMLPEHTHNHNQTIWMPRMVCDLSGWMITQRF